jgi:hypothetical protein
MPDNLNFSASILEKLFYYKKLITQKGLNSSSQFVFLMYFLIFTKTATVRLNSVDDQVVRPTQTTFMQVDTS